MGTVQVEGGQVDMVQDARSFWARMMHTVPDALSTKPGQQGARTVSRSDTSVGHQGGSGVE